jgi:hypothetical protein
VGLGMQTLWISGDYSLSETGITIGFEAGACELFDGWL